MSGELPSPPLPTCGSEKTLQASPNGSNGFPFDLAEKGKLMNSPFPPSSTATTPFCSTATTPTIEKPEPTLEVPLRKWNESRTSKYRICVAMYCFLLKGMADSAIGALIPYIEQHYHLNYTTVSLIFLAPFPGYIVVAMMNSRMHHTFGQRGVAILAPICRFTGWLIAALHPPFAAVAVLMILPGVGNAFIESCFNAWIGNLQNANELLGIFHAVFGLGATIGPLIATAMVTKGGMPWYSFYYLIAGMAGLEFVLTTTAFWGATGEEYRAQHAQPTDGDAGRRATTRDVLREPVPWLVAIFILIYVGVEVSVGGWIVTFMLEVRHAAEFESGMSATGFWLGLTVGRLILGFVTGRIGEKLATIAYMVLSAVSVLLFWLVPGFLPSAVFVAFLGFFLGPVFPACIVTATKLLPPEIHVSAIGFSAAFGGAGASILPFIVGVIAQNRGVQSLQPVALAWSIACAVIWLLLPGGFRKGELERARASKEKPGQRIWQTLRWAFGKLGRKSLT